MGITAYNSDVELVAAVDYLISIVPTEAALPVARRVSQALQSCTGRSQPLYYMDMNAVSATWDRSTMTSTLPCERKKSAHEGFRSELVSLGSTPFPSLPFVT